MQQPHPVGMRLHPTCQWRRSCFTLRLALERYDVAASSTIRHQQVPTLQGGMPSAQNPLASVGRRSAPPCAVICSRSSMGTVTSQAQRALLSRAQTQFSCSGTTGNYYRVNWSQGTTEGGSSGSAHLQGWRRRLLEHLYGRQLQLYKPPLRRSYYGRFDVAFNAKQSKNWLVAFGFGQSPVVSTGNRVPVYRFLQRARRVLISSRPARPSATTP